MPAGVAASTTMRVSFGASGHVVTRTVLALSLFCGAQPAPSSARYPAVDPPAPALVYAGGRFLRHPRVVTITWKGDDARLVR